MTQSRLWAGGGALALALAIADPASADTAAAPSAAAAAPSSAAPPVALFRLPFELAQGPTFAQAGKDVRYSFAVSALPGVGYGILDVNALLSTVYRNPLPDCFFCTLDVGTGVRTSVAVLSALEGALALRLAVEGEYLWRAQNARAAAGVMGDASSLLRLGFWVGRDWAAGAYFGSITVALDVMTLGDPIGALLRPGPVEDFGNAPK